jgi:sugar lactone lactonase YvrE
MPPRERPLVSRVLEIGMHGLIGGVLRSRHGSGGALLALRSQWTTVLPKGEFMTRQTRAALGLMTAAILPMAAAEHPARGQSTLAHLRPGIPAAAAFFDGAVLRVDAVTGDRAILSGGPVGGGPPLGCPSSIVVEASGTLVVHDNCGPAGEALLRIDPATGDRVIVSDPATGTGPGLFNVHGLAIENSGALLVVNTGSRGVLRVDPVNGNRTVLSGIGVGVGRDFVIASAIAVDSAGTIFVGDFGHWQCRIPTPLGNGFLCRNSYGALVRVDPGTGDRTVISGDGPHNLDYGTGPAFIGVWGSAVEPAGSIVVTGGTVSDLGRKGAIVRVDALSGNRAIVSDAKHGAGPRLSYPYTSIAVEASGSLVVLDPRNGQIVRVDAATGNRAVVSGGNRGGGPSFVFLQGIAVETDGSLLVTHYQ